jgi:glycosyltransferase involved in cell wall biosynthesis
MRILVVHDHLPQPNRSGSDLRFAQLVTELVALGHDVVFLARYGSDKAGSHTLLQKMGVQIFSRDAKRIGFLGCDEVPRWEFERVLASNDFDVALLATWFWFGISVPEHYIDDIRRRSPGAMVVVMTDDVHGAREAGLAQLTGAFTDIERARDYGEREFEIYRRADLVLTISEADKSRIEAAQESAPFEVKVLPMAADPVEDSPPFEQREGFLYLGDFQNSANVLSVSMLTEEIWPIIRARLPQATLCLAGNRAPNRLANPERGIVCLGHVPDLRPILTQSRVLLSPLRFGSGVSTKNLAALSHGLPLVTTEIGSRGLGLEHDETAIVSESTEEFAEWAIRLHSDRLLWERMSLQGLRYVAKAFSRKFLQRQISIVLGQRSAKKRSTSMNCEWSSLLVEKRFPETLTFQPSGQRLAYRQWAYYQTAQQLRAEGRPRDALRQLRHIFSFTRIQPLDSDLFDQVLTSMAGCYCDLSDHEGEARCMAGMKRRLPS